MMVTGASAGPLAGSSSAETTRARRVEEHPHVRLGAQGLRVLGAALLHALLAEAHLDLLQGLRLRDVGEVARLVRVVERLLLLGAHRRDLGLDLHLHELGEGDVAGLGFLLEQAAGDGLLDRAALRVVPLHARVGEVRAADGLDVGRGDRLSVQDGQGCGRRCRALGLRRAGPGWRRRGRAGRQWARRPPIGDAVRRPRKPTGYQGSRRRASLDPGRLPVEGHPGEADHAAGVDVPLLVVAQRAPPGAGGLEERVRRRRPAPVQRVAFARPSRPGPRTRPGPPAAIRSQRARSRAATSRIGPSSATTAVPSPYRWPMCAMSMPRPRPRRRPAAQTVAQGGQEPLDLGVVPRGRTARARRRAARRGWAGCGRPGRRGAGGRRPGTRWSARRRGNSPRPRPPVRLPRPARRRAPCRRS